MSARQPARGQTGREVLLSSVSEADWQAQVLEWARLGGWTHFHAHACPHYRRNAAGFPDVWLLRERLVVAELKTEQGAATTGQLVWLVGLRRLGILAEVWRPSDADYVRSLLLNPPGVREGPQDAQEGHSSRVVVPNALYGQGPFVGPKQTFSWATRRPATAAGEER